MNKEMFINAQQHECRIAIVAEGVLSELYTERASSLSHVGNIYKGRITNVEPSIQAAFVDFGRVKNGFLHISDLHPRYFPAGQNQVEAVGKKRARRERPPIQNCLKRGQEVVAQVTKEGIGTKGATLTTYLSIPGRYLVLMPGMHRLGVSRKIEDETSRSHIREILEELKPPDDLGFIVRTAGLDRSKQDLQRDLHYLLRLWKAVERRSQEAHAPAELYQESDLVIRTLRDVYNAEIHRVVCDDEPVACRVKEFLQLTMPRSANQVELYTGEVGLFHAFGLEQEIDRINAARVPLPGGGSLVIDQAEALVAIDVNSGRFRQTDNAEATAVRINTEAAREVARQLRLRDLGGVVIIDFIDMTEEKHRRQIEKILRDEVHEDRAKTKILKISRLGIIEMTRQRVRPSLTSSIFRPCPHCAGAGRIKSEESQALAAVRTLSLAADDERVAKVELTVPPPVADHLLNHRRENIIRLEQRCRARILIHADASLPGAEFRVACFDARGLALTWDVSAALASRPKDVPTRQIIEEDVSRLRSQAGQPVSGIVGAEPVELDETVEALGEAGGEPAAAAEILVTPPAAPVAVSVAGHATTTPAPAAGAPGGQALPTQPPLPGQTGPAQPGQRRRRHRGGRKHARRKAKAAAAAQTGTAAQSAPLVAGHEPDQPPATAPTVSEPLPSPSRPVDVPGRSVAEVLAAVTASAALPPARKAEPVERTEHISEWREHAPAGAAGSSTPPAQAPTVQPPPGLSPQQTPALEGRQHAADGQKPRRRRGKPPWHRRRGRKPAAKAQPGQPASTPTEGPPSQAM